jgi:nitroreductase
MSFLDLANKRSSIRGYDSESIDEPTLNKILDAGRIAPSAANQQPWHFIVIRDPLQREALKEAYRKEWFWKAPVVIVLCVEPSKAWTRQDGKNYAAVDGAIAMDHITLCAADLGLGTCWVGAFDPAKVKNILGLPDGIEPLVMTPLGKPVAPSLPKKRKALDQIVHYERW